MYDSLHKLDPPASHSRPIQLTGALFRLTSSTSCIFSADFCWKSFRLNEADWSTFLLKFVCLSDFRVNSALLKVVRYECVLHSENTTLYELKYCSSYSIIMLILIAHTKATSDCDTIQRRKWDRIFRGRHSRKRIRRRRSSIYYSWPQPYLRRLRLFFSGSLVRLNSAAGGSILPAAN